MENSSKWEEFFYKYRYPILAILLGLILVAFGVLFFRNGAIGSQTKIEVLEGATAGQGTSEITVEIAGSVEKPGVYKLTGDSRVEDLLIISGGFSTDADRNWTDKYLNRAAVLTDGQKIYIPNDEQSKPPSANSPVGDQTISSNFSSDSEQPVNINTASLKELDSLPGIGQTYGQNIIDHRPYSKPEELVSKGAIKQGLFEKIKDLISVY